MTAQEKVDKLNAWIMNGGIVMVTSYLHCWKITKKTLQRFNDVGLPVFKAKKNELFMASGNSYVCIEGCKIKAY